jgi:cysteinyl-tRNA synthetase
MGKSKGNFITLEELFAGRHEALDQPYSPMTIRFFILQAHYRSTLDFSNEALQAAEKGLKRLMQAAKDVVSLKHSADAPTLKQVASIKEEIYQALLDDINTPVALSSLFEAVKIVNGAKDKGEVLNDADYNTLNRLFTEIVSDVLGLTDDRQDASAELLIGGLVDMILQTRNAAKAARNWAESDRIRDELKAIGIQIKDTKEGTEWELTN